MVSNLPLKTQAGKNFVVSIDFGSSGSGYAILFVKDEEKVFSIKTYPDAPSETYNKNLSCILYENGKRHSIGFTARKIMYFENDEDDASDEEEDEDEGESEENNSESEEEEEETLGSTSTAPQLQLREEKNRKFIRDLKIQFMEATREGIEIPTIEISNDGTTKSLLDVMADYLAMLFNDFIMKNLKDNDASVKKTDVRWCITVPANYSEYQKSLMRKVACKAKIVDKEDCDENELIIISEADAATMFCMKHKAKSKPLVNGETFMVVDAGGGTVDVSCHILTDGKLKELAVQKADLCGSTFIDKEFIKVSEENCPKFDAFREKYPESYVKLLASWETAKRKVANLDNRIHFEPPAMFKESEPKSSFFRKSTCNITISTENVKKIFENQIAKTIKLIDEVYREYENDYPERKMDHLFIVGGLGDNVYLQNCIRNNFGNKFKELVFPAFCSNAVLEGGALLAKDPSYIRARKSKLTYGVGVMEEYEPEYHDPLKYEIVGGNHMAVDVLDVFVRYGDEVDIETTQTREYECLPGSSQIDVVLYSSKRKDKTILYTDSQGIFKEETIIIPFADSSKEADRRVFVTFFFGKSELNITVKNAQGEVKEIKRDFGTMSLAL